MMIRTKLEDRQERFTYLMIVASCICFVIQLYAVPRHNAGLMSLSNQALLLLWLGVGGVRIIWHLAKAFPAKLISFVWLLLFTVASLLVATVRGTGTLAADIKAFLNFMVLPVMLLHCAVYAVPEKTKTALLVTAVVLAVNFALLYHSGYRHIYTGPYADTNIPEVTLGYPNPNQTAMYLFVCLIVITAGIFHVKRKLLKVLLSLIGLYLLWITVQTYSRTAVLLVAVMALGLLLTRKRPLPRWSVDVAVFIPIAYAVLALFFSATFRNATFWGEPLFNGRENIFYRYLDGITFRRFLLGDFSGFRFDNMHNAYISIASTAGIFAAVSHLLFMRKCVSRNYQNAFDDMPAKVGFFGFLCIMIYSSTEAAFFVGGSTYAFAVLTVFLLFSKPFAADRPQ